MKDCDDASITERISRWLTPKLWWVYKLVRKLRGPGSFVAGLSVVALAVVQGLRAGNWGGNEAWGTGDPWWWVLVLLGGFTSLLSFLVVVGYRRLLKSQHIDGRLAKAAHVTLRYVERYTGIDASDLGVNIWRVRGVWGFRQLIRAAIAVEEPREETPILWTKGKGAIGRSWNEDRTVFADLEDLRTVLKTQEEFCSIPWNERFRFTWHQFEETDRYQAVLAIPIRARRYGQWEVRAVLAIDVLAAGKGTLIDGIQTTPKMRSIRRTCQAVLLGDEDEGHASRQEP